MNELSEKNIIEILENHAKYTKAKVVYADTRKEYKVSEAIQGLLDLYNKEKEENKELEKYKRLAKANLKDADDFKNNMCEHRCIKYNEILELKSELEKKDKIINLMAERLEHDTEWFYSEFDNYTKQDFIEYFKNKVEEDK